MKIALTLIALALPLAMPAALSAQAPAQARPTITPPPPLMPVTAIEPARVQAAARLIEVVMPPARMEAVVDGMQRAMSTNLSRALESNPGMGAIRDDSNARAVFTRFIDRVQAETRTMMRATMPEMMTAMTRAYARRFTVAQMAEMQTFFATPTGQLYMDQSANIMADPDVTAWQQKLMSTQLARMPAMMQQLQTEMMALKPKGAK